MGRKPIYPIELKEKVLAEYSVGVVGYKRLAAKYNLTRDLVRDWVKQREKTQARLEKISKQES